MRSKVEQVSTDEVQVSTVQPPPMYVQTVQSPPAQPVMASNTVVQLNTTNVNEAQPPYPQNRRPWSSGLLACSDDCGICLCGWCCPMCLSCQVSSQMGESCCTGWCCGILPLRVKLRTMLGITGTIDNDDIVVCCCYECALCQMARELKHWGMA